MSWNISRAKAFLPTLLGIHDQHPDFFDADLTYNNVRSRLQAAGWDFITKPLFWDSGVEKDQYKYLVNEQPHADILVMNLHGYHDLEGVDAWLRGRGK
ncbi:MAG TPA: hypothetical protein VHV10_20085 [Ktedonobacteraceae bacterium]|jgi:hypothetical protein|nr:hypothetical protein [Ktedonobacteraceae bacterium]